MFSKRRSVLAILSLAMLTFLLNFSYMKSSVQNGEISKSSLVSSTSPKSREMEGASLFKIIPKDFVQNPSEAVANIIAEFCLTAMEIAATEKKVELLRDNIEESCQHYRDVALPDLHHWFSLGEENKFEYYKRRLARSMFHQHFYLNRFLNTSAKPSVIKELQTQFRTARAKLNNVTISPDFEQSRKERIEAVGQEMQMELFKMQGFGQTNESCSARPTVTCHYIGTGGYAFGLQRLKWCFAAGHVLDRRVVFNARNHFINPDFYQTRNWCNDKLVIYYQKVNELDLAKDYYVVLPKNDPFLKPFMPRFVARRWVNKLNYLVDDVPAWYLGQLTKFILAPSEDLWTRMVEKASKIGLNLSKNHESNLHPIAGVHIRRGSKVTEAALQPTKKYVEVVEEYFLYMEVVLGRSLQRQVYLATLDSQAEKEWHRLAPNHVLHKIDWQLPEEVKSMKVAALESIMTDIMFLAHCDFFVGTFSSSVSGLTYHLRNVIFDNAPDSTVSLDSMWFLNPWHNRALYRANRNHSLVKFPDEMELVAGDKLLLTDTISRSHNKRDITGPHFEAIRVSRNDNRKAWGWYPFYKADLEMEDAVFEEEDLRQLIQEAQNNATKRL